jgi:hypothetical protein
MILCPPERAENPPPYALFTGTLSASKILYSIHASFAPAFIFTPEFKFASYITGVVKHGGL